MSTINQAVITQVYEIYIKATPQKIWDAITMPEWIVRYGYRCPAQYELRPGGSYRLGASADMVAMGIDGPLADGEVIEADPPHRLVQTYRFLVTDVREDSELGKWVTSFSDEHRAEGFSRVTWEIAATESGFSRLTVTHELEGKPITAGMVSARFSEAGTGGWSWILSDLKTLLETGAPL